MKIVFFGTPEFTITVLKALIAGGYQVSAVVTQPDSEAGRKKTITHPPVKQAAEELGIKIFQPSSLKDDSFFETFKSIRADLVIIAGYGKIIPEKYLSVPKYGFLCVHPSLLPKYRGPSPIQGAILNGDSETGVSIILMDKEMDHGSILSIEKYKLEPTDALKETEKKLWGIGARLLIKTIPKYIDGTIKPQKQNHEKATFTKLLTRQDGRIDWSKPNEHIYNQIRAFNSEPGTWTTWGGKILNIFMVETNNAKVPFVLQRAPLHPGIIEKIDNDIAIGTGTGYLILKSIQLEGGKEMDAKSFANGHPDFLNSKLGPA